MGQTWKFGVGAATKAWRAVLSGRFFPLPLPNWMLTQVKFMYKTNFKQRDSR